MLKATIHDLALFENFLGIINKFVQQCQFILDTNGVKVFCKNPTGYASSRLLLDSNVLTLNEEQELTSIKICIRDVISFKSAISIVQQIEDVNEIEIGLEDIDTGNDTYIKSIKYKSKNGGSFSLITIDVDVIKALISKEFTAKITSDWEFYIDPKKLDIAQNRTNNIVNMEEVSVYVYPSEPNGKAIIELSSKKTASINSISIPISSDSIGSLKGFPLTEIPIHESSFRLFNILKTTDDKGIHCIFNKENNLFFITSKINSEKYYINSRLFVQMVKGK